MTAAALTTPPAPPAVRHSAVYEGWVRHRRFAPAPHSFRYRISLLYLDLAEEEQVLAGRWLWSNRGLRPGLFRRADYLGDPALPLDEAVRRRAAEVLGRRPQGAVRVLTQPRTFGHCFNPVSFYYCFQPPDAAGHEALDCLLAEITNTPWGERHSYVLAAQAGPRQRWRFAKQFHVSPFWGMDHTYDWRCRAPGERLSVHMENLARGQRVFDASMALRRRPLGGGLGGLNRLLFSWPPRTARVLAAIYWQALRLWWKGARFHDHPRWHPESS